MSSSSKYILIVGSEGGLGQKLAKVWISKGYHVIGVDLQRGVDSYSQHFIQLDLATEVDRSIIQEVKSITPAIDGVLFVAASGYFGDFLNQANIAAILRINFLSIVKLLHLLADSIKVNSPIIFIGSIASHMPTADYEVYSASKLAIEGFVRSFKEEVRGRFLLKVYLPGGMKTAFHDRVGFNPSAKAKSKFLDPSVVAEDIWKFSLLNSWRGVGCLAHRLLLIIDHWCPILLNTIFRRLRS